MKISISLLLGAVTGSGGIVRFYFSARDRRYFFLLRGKKFVSDFKNRTFG